MSSAVNNTDKEADPNKTDDDVNVDLKTANVENFAINFNESLEKDREASTVSTFPDEARDDTGDVTRDFSNATESTGSEDACRYDKGATESSLDESNANGTERTRNQEENSTVLTETVATNFELQQDIRPKQEETAYTSSDDDAVTASYVEVESISTSAAETTTVDAVGDDGIRKSDRNTDVSTNSSDTCGQNKSICSMTIKISFLFK